MAKAFQKLEWSLPMAANATMVGAGETKYVTAFNDKAMAQALASREKWLVRPRLRIWLWLRTIPAEPNTTFNKLSSRPKQS